eukprot:8803825-Pyramimonas_sp.AAC.1
MGNRGFSRPDEAAPAELWGGYLLRSMDLATARQIHESLIPVCWFIQASRGPLSFARKRCALDPRIKN